MRTRRTQEKYLIGIDNGVSGSIGITGNNTMEFYLTPVFSSLNYTKKAKNVTRIDTEALALLLRPFEQPKFAILERPMVNPGRFQATASALRALEATLIVLERLNIGYRSIDSGEWQRDILPRGIKGSDKLKEASKQRGIELFPHLKEIILKRGDADGLLISEWARRKGL